MAASVPSRRIATESLLEISNDLWGSAVYGQTAISVLDVWRVDQSTWAEHTFLFGDRAYTQQEMAELALDKWDDTRLPYEPVLVHNGPGFVYARAGALSRLRLADFSRRQGYDAHNFHGTLGKTFDVLAVASGVKKAKDVGAAHVETEFITSKQLHAHLRAVELSRYYRDEINSELRSSIGTAVWHSRTPKFGEVIFEGSIGKPGTMNDTFEQVAISSLVALAHSLPENRPTAQALLSLAA